MYKEWGNDKSNNRNNNNARVGAAGVFSFYIYVYACVPTDHYHHHCHPHHPSVINYNHLPLFSNPTIKSEIIKPQHLAFI